MHELARVCLLNIAILNSLVGLEYLDVSVKKSNPLTTELYFLEFLFRLVAPFFTCISTSGTS